MGDRISFHEGDFRSYATLVEELRDLPPSAKLAFKILQYEGDLTQEGIVEETLLPPRTVRNALTELEENGIITSQSSIIDARQRVYSLDPSFQEGDADGRYVPYILGKCSKVGLE